MKSKGLNMIKVSLSPVYEENVPTGLSDISIQKTKYWNT